MSSGVYVRSPNGFCALQFSTSCVCVLHTYKAHQHTYHALDVNVDERMTVRTMDNGKQFIWSTCTWMYVCVGMKLDGKCCRPDYNRIIITIHCVRRYKSLIVLSKIAQKHTD